MPQQQLVDVDFKGQFLLSHNIDKPFQYWASVELQDWFLHFCTALRLTKILDRGLNIVGYILGWAITSDGVLLGEIYSVGLSTSAPNFVETTERIIESLSGRFIAILISENHQRVYLDPAGQLSAVYNNKSCEVASSLFLISEYTEPTGDLAQQLNFPEADAYFPFGITHSCDVWRLIPNHFLDLAIFEMIRHWPRDGELDIRTSEKPYEVAAQIGKKLQQNIQAISEVLPISIPLTAGMDSRMLLAASKNIFHNVQFHTIRIPDQAAELDCKVAIAISRRFRLKHKILEWQKPSKKDLNDWQIRSGFACSGRTWTGVSTVRQLSPDLAVLVGLCGEVGRSFLWTIHDFETLNIDASEILRRLGFPEHHLLLDGAMRWLEALPAENPFTILDLLYLEQRLGCWAGPSHIGHIHNVQIVPLSDRAIFAMMLSLPDEYRFSQCLAPDLIRSLWPALLKFPFNKEIGIARLSNLLASVLARIFVQYPSLKKIIPWLT